MTQYGKQSLRPAWATASSTSNFDVPSPSTDPTLRPEPARPERAWPAPAGPRFAASFEAVTGPPASLAVAGRGRAPPPTRPPLVAAGLRSGSGPGAPAACRGPQEMPAGWRAHSAYRPPHHPFDLEDWQTAMPHSLEAVQQ